MGEDDFDTVTTIAAERSDIGITMSSTPTGKRSQFYKACMDKKMGYTEHFHPSTHNPNWCDAMEAEFRAQLSEQGYVHEILAEFGTQDTGVFDKVKLDRAMKIECYAYNPLDYYQERRLKESNTNVSMLLYDKAHKAPPNPFRTMGVDWDKYQASSSILILDYDVNIRKFKVIKRIEVPRGEYSYDNAINMIVELNEIYNPSFIYCDRGSGEYQIERLHIYGDEHPRSNLKNKVKGFQFKQTLDIMDPSTKEITREPMKPFMVTQLQIAVEREMLALSPFDEVLHKQLIDYEVEKISSTGVPTFTSKNEHFVDALGLAYLAMVLEFKELVGTVKDVENTSKFIHMSKSIGQARVDKALTHIETSIYDSATSSQIKKVLNDEDRGSDKQHWVKVNQNYRKGSMASVGWGSRTGKGNRSNSRSMW